MLKRCIELIKENSGDIIFDEPTIINDQFGNRIFTAFGAAAEGERLFLLDGAGEWHGPVLLEDRNGDIIIKAIYDHLYAIVA